MSGFLNAALLVVLLVPLYFAGRAAQRKDGYSLALWLTVWAALTIQHAVRLS